MQRQLDIFDDSRDVMLRNDLAQALLEAKVETAQRIHGALQADFAGDRALAPAAVLIEHLRWQQGLATPGQLDAKVLLLARRRLADTVAAAALAVLGAQGTPAWLDSQWCWLAQQAAGIGWHPLKADGHADGHAGAHADEHAGAHADGHADGHSDRHADRRADGHANPNADAHAASLYLRGRAWRQAADAVAGIASWRRIPVPLLWMTQARWQLEGADAAWPLLAEALWLAPTRAAALLPALDDRHINRLAAKFDERFDLAAVASGGWAWLPAFAVVDQPLLAAPLAAATPPADMAAGQAFAVVMALLRLERQGRHHEIVAHRAQLRALSVPLFAAYMATR